MRVAGIPLGVGQNTLNPSPLTLALLHFDGANGSTTFTDSSANSQNIIANNGNTGVYLSNGWSKFGATSCFFNGDVFVNYLRTNSAYVGGNLGAGDWQIDCWIRPATVSGLKGIFNIFNGSSSVPINLIINAGVLKVQVDTIANSAVWEFEVAHQTALFANSEYHVRALRKDGYIRLFLDGIEATTPANIGTTPLVGNGGGQIQIGVAMNYVGGFPQQFSGYIDEFRIRKEAVYTGNFTPPTAPFTY